MKVRQREVKRLAHKIHYRLRKLLMRAPDYQDKELQAVFPGLPLPDKVKALYSLIAEGSPDTRAAMEDFDLHLKRFVHSKPSTYGR